MFFKQISSVLFTALAISLVFIFALVIKGDKGDPIAFQNIHDARIEGPFESSNNNARYALVEAIADQGSLFFTEAQARFAAPDLVQYNNKFFSIFTPGVSFIGVPFYLLGKFVGLPQLLTYFSTHLFAVLNFLLVVFLTIKLGGKIHHGIFSGLVFVFATNALPYALTFTQHHISTSLILLGILNLFSKHTFVNNIFFGAIFGAGILMDIPNAFLLLPALLYIFYKNFFVENLVEKVKIGVKTAILGLFLGLLPFVMLYGWYNYQTTGSYTKIAQFIGRSDYPPPLKKIDYVEQPKEEKNLQTKLFDTPFNTRLQANGLYILLLSNERGIFYYSPVLLIGAAGLFIAYRSKKSKTAVIVIFSVIFMNIILYSLFGDPWGGWSFGPRYLIPASALLSAGIGIALWRFVKNPIFIVAFFGLLIYSVSLSFAGALTTNIIPPKVEAQNLITPIPYTYEYNLQFIDEGKSSSLLYNLYFGYFVSLRTFWYALVGAVLILALLLYGYVFFRKEGNKP